LLKTVLVSSPSYTTLNYPAEYKLGTRVAKEYGRKRKLIILIRNKTLIDMVILSIIGIAISFIAITLTLLKDFIFPKFLKPKIVFQYKEDMPFRIEDANVPNDQGELDKACFIRFSVHNKGRRPAINCRAQLYAVYCDSKIQDNYQGFPLRWANRPINLDYAKAERLNIGIGEIEFVDLIFTIEGNKDIHFQKGHDVKIGFIEILKPRQYIIEIIFSGDNFKPFRLKFNIDKKNNDDPNSIIVKLINNKI